MADHNAIIHELEAEVTALLDRLGAAEQARECEHAVKMRDYLRYKSDPDTDLACGVNCRTVQHCERHGRCLAECSPADVEADRATLTQEAEKLRGVAAAWENECNKYVKMTADQRARADAAERERDLAEKAVAVRDEWLTSLRADIADTSAALVIAREQQARLEAELAQQRKVTVTDNQGTTFVYVDKEAIERAAIAATLDRVKAVVSQWSLEALNEAIDEAPLEDRIEALRPSASTIAINSTGRDYTPEQVADALRPVAPAPPSETPR